MFFSGQKVLCVDDEGCPTVRRGAIYTIRRVLPVASRHCIPHGVMGEMAALALQEAEPPAYCEGFWLGRFRPVTNRPTDITLFKRMLHKKRLKA